MENATVTNRQLLPFFGLTLVLAMPSYILIALASGGVILSPEMAFSFVPLATFAPLLAALIFTFRKGGWAATKSLLWRVVDFRRISNKLWLVAALMQASIDYPTYYPR